MNKDYELKQDPRISQCNLRERISEGIKRQRDEVREVKDDKIKSIARVPSNSNHDSSKNLKHSRNKI